MTKYQRYDRSDKGRTRSYRYNRTAGRLRAQRDRNQVRRERLARSAILALAEIGGTA